MSFFFGGGKKAKPQFTGLQTQTSSSALPVPIIYGMNRAAPNIIYQGNFKSHKQKQKAGKGGPSVTTYTYSADFQLGLCYGVIAGIGRAWRDTSKKNSYTSFGWTLATGTRPQAPWGYLVTKAPSKALGYPDIATLSAANYNLETSNSLQQHSFEIKGVLYDTQVGVADDAEPAAMIEDFLDNEIYGVGFGTSVIDQDSLFSGPDAPTTGDSAFQTYCQVMGFAMSPILVSQQPAGEILEKWADLCNTAIVWTGYSLKFHPYGPDEITANGVTYLPNFPVRYTLTDRDFIYNEGEDPIRFNRTDPADASNSMSLIIHNRDNEYNELPVPWEDQALIDQYGSRPAENVDASEICDPDMAATMVALMGQRKAYIRNEFEFRLSPKYSLLEPMDILECVDPRLGTFYVLIKEIVENEEDMFDCIAEEYPASISSAPSNTPQVPETEPINTEVEPGPINPPIIFEPPSSLSSTPQVWVAVSGGDGTVFNESWGGCFVWISSDDITYNNIGEIDTASRQGVLASGLTTYGGVNPDTTDTLQVSLVMSNGELEDATAADAAAGLTVSYVDGELIAYETATLTGTNAYDLDTLYRGLYGSTISAHLTGTDFARLDDSIFKYDLPEAYVGQTVYLKFQSYNIFGGGVEDIDTCIAYPYVPTGFGFGGGSGGVPAIPTGFSGSPGAGFNYLTWTANSTNDNVAEYQVWRAPGLGASFGSAAKIGTAVGTEYTDSAIAPTTAYTYFLLAGNSVGLSTNTSGLDITSSSGAPSLFGFAFSQGDPVISKPIAQFDTPVPWSMPVSLTDSQGTIGDSQTATASAPSANTDFDIQSPPGVSVGTMRFAASSLTATFIMASQVDVPLGESTIIMAPANLNGITGKIYGSIKGTK